MDVTLVELEECGNRFSLATKTEEIFEARKNGKIAVLNFHGVPYPRAPWVSVEPKVFDEYMKYLHDQKCTVIAMRDLVKYVKPAPLTKVPLRREEGSFSWGPS